jgi:hypothetical protein
MKAVIGKPLGPHSRFLSEITRYAGRLVVPLTYPPSPWDWYILFSVGENGLERHTSADIFWLAGEYRKDEAGAGRYQCASSRCASGAGSTSLSRATHAYKVGIRKMLSSNPDINPPTMTIANGR